MQRYEPAASAIVKARELLVDTGHLPAGLLDEVIERSWRRCLSYDLQHPAGERRHFGSSELKHIRDRNERLLRYAMPELENLQRQVVHTGSMVVLTDVDGVLLHSAGEPDFVEKAKRVELAPGACWNEQDRGTNAIGTAMAEGKPVLVHGVEHFLHQNHFLTCCAAPIFDPFGQLMGVVDVSGEARERPRHVMALVRMTSTLVENEIFRNSFPDVLLIGFHIRPEFIGTLSEGLLAVDGNGEVLAANRSARVQLGLSESVTGTLLESVFDTTLARIPASPGRGIVELRTRQGVVVAASFRGPRGTRRYHAVETPRPAGPLDALDSGDPQVRDCVRKAARVVGRGIPILIEGETGTGKEVWARALHHAGPRANGPMVTVNCAALPESLIEAELFGYLPGAFTGARRGGAEGKIVQADGGTLFLDEIGDMPLGLQTRLLRVLQEREVAPLGGGRPRRVDFDLVCATNRDLKSMVDAGEFRADLYYRINGLRLCLPALRERSDLPRLVDRLVLEEAPDARVSDEVMALFLRHPWPGNIRQLRNVLRTAAALCDPGEPIAPRHLPPDFVAELDAPRGAAWDLREVELALMRETLRECGGNVSAAARRLGIDRSTLYRRLKLSGR